MMINRMHCYTRLSVKRMAMTHIVNISRKNIVIIVLMWSVNFYRQSKCPFAISQSSIYHDTSYRNSDCMFLGQQFRIWWTNRNCDITFLFEKHKPQIRFFHCLVHFRRDYLQENTRSYGHYNDKHFFVGFVCYFHPS